MPAPELPRLDRRTALKWMLAAAATALSRSPAGASEAATGPVGAHGYGTDPDLVKIYRPGELWPLTFTDSQRATAAALCAVIIPADSTSPSAAKLGVHDFIDEWISAPYPVQAADRPVVLEGLAWLEAEARRRFGRDFSQASPAGQSAICDDICLLEKAAPEFKAAARFFARFRDLAANGFYTTPEGMKDLGYIGNMPLATFDGPPDSVLKKLGLA